MRRFAVIAIGFIVAAISAIAFNGVLAGVVLWFLLVATERIHAKRGLDGGFSAIDTAFTVVGAFLVLGYALLITQQFVLGVVAVAAMILAAWLSGPTEAVVDEPGGEEKPATK